MHALIDHVGVVKLDGIGGVGGTPLGLRPGEVNNGPLSGRPEGHLTRNRLTAFDALSNPVNMAGWAVRPACGRSLPSSARHVKSQTRFEDGSR